MWLRQLARLFARIAPPQTRRDKHQSHRPSFEALENRIVPDASPANAARLLDAYGRVPLSFEANQGQADSQVRYLARGDGYSLFLTDDGAVLSLRRPGTDGASLGDVLNLRLVDANRAARILGTDPLPGKVNYFTKNNPAAWRT